MTDKNKFGFGPLDVGTPAPRRDRTPGPMGAAVRDAAESLHEATETKVEQRRRNAEDAKTYRTAVAEGRMLAQLSLAEIATDDLPRDRMDLDGVAHSDEMEELKSSIRERGQKEPVEVYVGTDGRYQLKKGWRRFTALSQLFRETGDDAFGFVTARIEAGQGDRVARYVDMVEENVIREDLTFAEMAQVAIVAAQDAGVDEIDPAEMVTRLYSALHKTKRSYIKSFVFLLTVLGDSLRFPKAVSRNLGVDVARALSKEDEVDALRKRLAECDGTEAQNLVLASFLTEGTGVKKEADTKAQTKLKFEFFVGEIKVTARRGECRLVSERDFATIPKARLEEAVKAFEEALSTQPRIR